MQKRRRLVVLGAILGVPLVLVTILLLYLNFADLSGWRDTAAGLASDAIGRELRINGEFQPEIGFTTRVMANDITLANADWSDEPQMMSADRLAGEIDLLSLLFGPITIHDVEISGARVLFETSTEGQFNWALGSGESKDVTSDRVGKQFEMVIGRASLNNIELAYISPKAEPLEVALSNLGFTDDGTGMLDLDLAGTFADAPIEISGRLGTFIGLINAGAVEHDLTGRFADADFSLRGTIDDLSSLSGVDGHVSIGGSELSRIVSPFGVDPVVEGAFNLEASVKPSATGSDFNLAAAAGGISAHSSGGVDSLTEPSILDATVTASGPSIRAIGTLTGIADLPEEEFSVSGGVRWEGFPITFRKLEITVGDNSLSADGVLGAPPKMLGTDFIFEGGGPNVAAIAALAGVDLPRDSFSVNGRLVRQDRGLDIEGVEARIGRTTVAIDGIVGDPPEYDGTALDVRANGPNLAHYQDLAGVALPTEPFEINGKLTQGDGAINLEAVRARVGRNSLEVSGRLKTNTGLAGTDLRLKARGPDASQMAAIADVSNVPSEPFGVTGRVSVLEKGYRVHDLVATLGSLAITANGFVAPPPTLVGSDLQIHVEDSDLSHPSVIAGIEGLPHDAFSIDTRLRVEDPRYRLDAFKAKVGDMELEADGRIGAPPELDGTQVHITARGPKLSSLNQYLDQTGLPPAPFSVSGNVQIIDGAYAIEGVVADVDGNRVTLNGTVHPANGLIGTDLEIGISAPDLGRTGDLASGFADLPPLPSEPLTLNTRLRIDEEGFLVEGLQATLAEATASIDGRVGVFPKIFGSDLTFKIDGPNASLLTSVTGVTMPVAPVQLNGRVERHDAGFRFHGVTARVGEYRAMVDGTLGELPKLIGTELEIHASGPGTGLIKELAGLPWLPDKPFTLDGEFSGTPEHFSTRDFALTFGPSDIEGSFAVDITGKPDVQARLTSNVIDLSRLRERLEEHEEDPTEGVEEDTPPADGATLLIPDEPIKLEWLNAADADVAIRVKKLVMPAMVFRDLKADLDLEDGRLAIERLAAVGQGEGRMDGNLTLEPSEGGYRLETELSASQLRLDVDGSEIDLAAQPPIDIDIDLEAVGATPHELASSANGAVQLVIGKGIMDSRVLDLVTTDILLTLLNAFNPFAKQDAATELQCGVALLSLEDGIAALEPMAFQSDKMTMLGDGKIDLNTEKLNLEWITKPRKGIGISASMITNPYIKLGGTLSAPAVQLKEAEAVVATGAAVATMGLSLVAKGMYDRVTAEKKVCKRALEEIARHSESSSQPSK